MLKSHHRAFKFSNLAAASSYQSENYQLFNEALVNNVSKVRCERAYENTP